MQRIESRIRALEARTGARSGEHPLLVLMERGESEAAAIARTAKEQGIQGEPQKVIVVEFVAVETSP